MDYGYNLDTFDVEYYYKRYCEALKAVDDNVGRVLEYLRENNLESNTLVVYMGDNGFQFGEHGLIDKRTAYEASIKIPLLMYYPGQLQANTKVNELVANIDIAPTLMEVAGLDPDADMDGDSFWSLARGHSVSWRNSLLYEYYWEWNYPQTPTVFAIRGDRYKFIRYHGLWDTDELYDLRQDPMEMTNLINSPEHQEIAADLKKQLFDLLQGSNGLKVPILPDRGRQFYYRHQERTNQGSFPHWFYQRPEPVTR